MIKKYGFTIFFCFLFMLCGIFLCFSYKVDKNLSSTAISINNSYPDETTGQLLTDIGIVIENVYGYGSLGANIGGVYGGATKDTDTDSSDIIVADNDRRFSFSQSSTSNIFQIHKLHTVMIGGVSDGEINSAYLGYKQLKIDSVDNVASGLILNNNQVSAKVDGHVSYLESLGGGDYKLNNDVIQATNLYGFNKRQKLGWAQGFVLYLNIYWPVFYTLNANGGRGGNTSVVYDTYGQSMQLYTTGNISSISVPTRTGYNFMGYYNTSSSSGGTQVINASGEWTGKINRNNARPGTLYARWEPVYQMDINGWTPDESAQYAVTFDEKYNGTTYTKRNNEAVVPVAHNKTIELSEFVVSKYNNTDCELLKENVKLVRYDGTEINEYLKITWNSNNQVTYIKVTTNFKFDPVLDPNTGDPIWDPILELYTSYKYSITFVNEHAPNLNYTYGKYEPFSLPTPQTAAGYTFKGWVLQDSDNANNTFGQFKPGKYEVVDFTNWPQDDHELTFVAQWTANTYTVGFDAENNITYPITSIAINGTPSSTINYDNMENDQQVVSITINETAVGNSSGFYVPSSKWLEIGVEYVWSVYIRSSVDHALYIGHEQGGTTTVNVTTEWQKITHRFTATQTSYRAFVFYVRNSSWTAGEVFEFKGLTLQKASEIKANEPISSITVTYDQKYTNLPTPTRYGYDFAGWYTAEDGGNLILNTHEVKITRDTMLYSRWTAKTDCVLMYDSSAVGNMENWEKVLYGERFTVDYDSNGFVNYIAITGQSNWEIMAIPIYLPNFNLTYTISFDYDYLGSRYGTCGSGDLRMQVLTSYPTDGKNQDKQVAYGEMRGEKTSVTINIQPTQLVYYLTLNLGYFSDNTLHKITIQNLTITCGSAEEADQPKVIQYNKTYNSSIGDMYVGDKFGYIFTGWHAAEENGDKVTPSTIMDSEIKTVYAQWADTWMNHTTDEIEEEGGYYIIDTPQKFARLIYLFNGSTDGISTMKFKLTANIDMSEYLWLPIGTEERPFTATLDGSGYTVRGIRTISQDERADGRGDNSGIFGVTTASAWIGNIYFEDVEINGKSNVGGLVGKVNGNTTISSTAIIGRVNGETMTGAIAGQVEAGTLTVTNSLVIIGNIINFVNEGLYNLGKSALIAMTSTLYEVTGVRGASSGDFAGWTYVQNMEYPLPTDLSWQGTIGEGLNTNIMTLWKTANEIPYGDMESGCWSVTTTTEDKYEGESSIKLTASASVAEVTFITLNKHYLDNTHIYYASVYAKSTITGVGINIYWPSAEPSFGQQRISEANEWQRYSWRVSRRDFTNGDYPLRLDFDNNGQAGTMYFDNLMLIDLTAIFGAGNEPDKAWLDKNYEILNVSSVSKEDLLKLIKADNLLTNGDMENTGWVLNGNTEYSQEHVYSGEYSIKLTGTTSSSEILLSSSQKVAIDPTHRYYVMVYGYQESKTEGASVEAFWPVMNGYRLGSHAVKDGGSWQLYSWTVTRPDQEGEQTFRFDFNNNQHAGTIYYDNAKIIDLTEIFGPGKEPDKAWLDRYAYLIASG